jgi:glycosyltransferase involved in cell wall biosynthesis
MKKYKIALIHNIVAPYRVPFFEKLSKYPKIDLFVYYCAKTQKDRLWDIKEGKEYLYKILPGLHLDTSKYFPIALHFNPSIIIEIIRGNYNVIIIDECTDPTTQLAFLISKLLRKKIILWSEATEKAQRFLGKVILPLRKFIAKRVDAIVVPGTETKRLYLKLGVNEEKIFIAPNIVDNEYYINNCKKYRRQKRKIKKKFGLENKKVILYVGQLVERKGIAYLIRAYKKLKKEEMNIGLVIVGDGPQKQELKEKSKNIKDIYFVGWVSEEDKLKYYSIADLFVLPTLQDVWGLVINEAMACSLPIIATNAAGCAVDLIKSRENGFIVKEANINQLYLAMKEILSNKKLNKKMSATSLRIIKSKYSIKNMVGGFVSAIEFSYKNKS